MTAAEIVFRDYRPEDRRTIIALLSKGRPADYLSQKEAVFDWQFFGNPESKDRSPFVVGTLGDEIVAVNGILPVSIRFGGERLVASWSLDTYVSADHRGRGFGKALIARVSSAAPVMLGFGISDMSDPILAKAGWTLDASMATMFYHANEIGLKGFAKNLLTRSSRTLRSRKASALSDIRLEPAPPAHELDALWSRVASQFPNAVERSAKYLTWHYRDAPVLRYRWVTARRDGELCGVLITRHHEHESVVVDYLGPLDDPALIGSLIEVGCADLVASATRRVRCETNASAILEELAGLGFMKYRTASRFRVRANVARPPATSPAWFVMAGDSDGDLLTL
jgi:GNAT superfamily N-acetyltransferase